MAEMASLRDKTKLVGKFISIIERMLQTLLKDLMSGIKLEKAGWRSLGVLGITPTDQTELLRRSIIERNSKNQLRLNFRNTKIRREFRIFNRQFEQLDCFLKDIEKVEKAQKILKQIEKMLQNTPDDWKYVIALGWWNMLEVSEMPAKMNDILREGFSPEDWMTKTPRCSSELALNIARKYGRIDNFKEAVVFLENIKTYNHKNFTLPLSICQDEVQRVMKVLKWEYIKEELTDFEKKMLGFLWTIFFVLNHNNLLPYSKEFSLKLYEIILKGLENLLKKKQL